MVDAARQRGEIGLQGLDAIAGHGAGTRGYGHAAAFRVETLLDPALHELAGTQSLRRRELLEQPEPSRVDADRHAALVACRPAGEPAAATGGLGRIAAAALAAGRALRELALGALLRSAVRRPRPVWPEFPVSAPAARP